MNAGNGLETHLGGRGGGAGDAVCELRVRVALRPREDDGRDVRREAGARDEVELQCVGVGAGDGPRPGDAAGRIRTGTVRSASARPPPAAALSRSSRRSRKSTVCLPTEGARGSM